MSAYNSVLPALLSGITNYCREEIETGFESREFLVSPLLAFLAAQHRDGVNFGSTKVPSRVPVATLVGGKALGMAARRKIIETFQTTIRIQDAKVGGNKRMQPLDTMPSTGGVSLDQVMGSVAFRPTQNIQPMFVPGVIERYNNEKGVFGAEMSQTIREGMEEQNQIVGYDLLAGLPPNVNAAEWSSPFGVLSACDDGTGYSYALGDLGWNTGGGGTAVFPGTQYGYGGTIANHPKWKGVHIRDSLPASLALIDKINLYYGLRSYGPGVDLLLVSFPAFARFKAEAANTNAVNINLMSNEDECYKFGILKEGIYYNGCWIVPDPFLANYKAASVSTSPYPSAAINADLTTVALALTTGSWTFATHRKGNYSTTPWREGVIAGEADGYSSMSKLIYEPACHQRWNQAVITNLSF
jgi:hypothetical protein